MNTKNLFLIALCTMLAYLPANAQEAFQVKSFKMTVSGTSTLHDWESDVTKLEASGNLDFSNAQLTDIQSLKVTIPAKGIVSPKGRIMDNKTYDALKADKYPDITFRLDRATVNGQKIQAYGKLCIAGKYQTVSLDATSKTDKAGNITFSGSKTIKMTDFGMEPPTALMGTIKTGDEVTIQYELALSPTGEASGTH
ncbi:MAG: YceI family protein [Lewinellaceae bacterium]|nr:YceI family protein [Lewinellaceae bacterium]